MLAETDAQAVLHVPCDSAQDNLFHNLSWNWGKADKPVVPWILFPTFLVDGGYTGYLPVLWDLPG